ncbi:MAG: cell division protein SepF [Lachnospiraceae bacterium]|jgi:cell division inhibitor SepF|nr:cell division protein SepF [Lachnospiraceae bacterium]MCI8969168.1 cell division protein SepF [Lachnospiraceae bacterium]MDE6941849.1 cell division protein SepF [Lachnospiraceae bacterium]MDE6990937.1 cell division protein SepF [Lachnospiraceae bacterium]MDE7002630.1 cell division protein SepF [Lachnospiraceae bacterium]
MGVMDKFLDALHLNNEEEYYDDDDFYDEGEIIDNTVRKPMRVVREEEDFDEPIEKPRKQSQKVTPIRAVKRAPGNGMEVCVIRPNSIEDAREITETLLANRTVVLNLEGLDVAIAQRIIDFASGSTYAINGNLQKISNCIFIITPASVDISGDFQEILSGTFDVPISRGVI